MQHWDGTFKLSRTDTGALVQSIGAHKDTVTCVAIDSIGSAEVVVTGSKDATVMVWNMTETPAARDSLPLDATPRHILHGHDDEVTSVAVNQDFDAIVSASLDGTLIQSRLRAGEYVRTIVAAGRAPLHAVKLSKQGHILSYSLVDRHLRLYSINGVPLAQIDAKERIYSLAFSDNGHSLVTGSDRRVLIRRTHDLGVVRLERDTRCPVRALSLTADEQHLLVGLQSGQLMVCALDAKILRERTLQKLTDLGF
jgi:WD40 repeat protein